MSDFEPWLRGVIENGESIQSGLPVLSVGDSAEVRRLLQGTFEFRAREVAGPRLSFDVEVSLWAADLLALACWRSVGGEGPPLPLDGEREPTTPDAHLSADTILRFLPSVYRRVKNRGADDALVTELEAIARRWPLTGVLLDLEGPPTTSPVFAGHPGLQLLYAERFVENPRGEWLPPEGPGREWVERICVERGRPMPVPPAPLGEAASV